MIFRQLSLGPMQNFSYIIGDEKTKEAAVVDCGWEAEKIIKEAEKEKVTISKIILTHCHFDHVQKASELIEKTNATVYFHELENDEIKKFGIKNAKFFSESNDEVFVGNIKIKIMHTPGHTHGSICLLFEDKLLTGDTLFIGAIGRTDLNGGNPLKLFDSLQKIKKLNEDLLVYPGHDYGDYPFDLIKNQKKNNPYLLCNKKEEFLRMVG